MGIRYKKATVEDVIKLSNHFNIPMDILVGKDLSLENQNTYKELDVLFNKHKDILKDDDKETIKFIIEKRKREIDKELNEE